MKKFILAALVLSIGIGSAQVGYAETDISVGNQNNMRASYEMHKFKSYPPSKYLGMTLMKVEKTSGGYIGWYV
ncbi:hypothetical protein ACFQOY_08560 [Enterococcus alcedinis]|uniref:Bacteriocin n=1 Tax=Enterococcus alcedinis TaxID=1274384 RepID=A0A917JFX3_9ENTE|nr:hypothetical protein [Enterococcus alcedinis]MBP2101551.1 hypothetical protein [Enterococcus alcedinis]GGI65055.1 hypothetical protein GCM10011482_07090 [Enterococcus alcedinis]